MNDDYKFSVWSRKKKKGWTNFSFENHQIKSNQRPKASWIFWKKKKRNFTGKYFLLTTFPENFPSATVWLTWLLFFYSGLRNVKQQQQKREKCIGKIVFETKKIPNTHTHTVRECFPKKNNILWKYFFRKHYSIYKMNASDFFLCFVSSF